MALWSRLRDFDPLELSDLIAERRAVRTAVMRGTIHLLSARDCLAIQPLTLPLMAQVFKALGARGWLERRSRTWWPQAASCSSRSRARGDLGRLLAPRWPDADPVALAYVVTYHLPLVQVPPRALWRQRGGARWALAEQWLGQPLEADPSVDALVLRYLAACGPATVADARTWPRFTGLREVFERLRPGLRTFGDEQGRELFDVPSHQDRTRVNDGSGPGEPFPPGPTRGWLLVDGFYRANWHIADGEMHVDRFELRDGDPPGSLEAIEAEGAALVELFERPQSGQ